MRNLKLSDIDLFVLHQANLRIIESAADYLEIDRQKLIINIDRYGNTSGGSVPLVLDEASRPGRITRGDRILMSGYGAGLSWGTAIFAGRRRCDDTRLASESPGLQSRRNIRRSLRIAQFRYAHRHDRQSQTTAAPQPGQGGRHLGPVEPVCRRRRLGNGLRRVGNARSPATRRFAASWPTSAKTLAACLQFDTEFERAGERLGTYAFLKTAEDTANSDYQRMIGRYRNVASRAGQAASYIRPEIMAIPAKTMDAFLAAKPLAEFRAAARAAAALQAAHARQEAKRSCWPCRAKCPRPSNQIFRQLTDADLKWGTIKNEHGELVELSNASFSSFLQSPERSVRKKAFHQYYTQFAAHENTLAATLAGSIQRDVYYARARNYPSALAASLFHDKVPRVGRRQPDRRRCIATCRRCIATTICGGGRCSCATFTTTTPTCRS